MIRKFESFGQKNSIKFKGVDFEITPVELDEILIYITDEFPNITYTIFDSIQSSLIEPAPNSFTVIFNEDSDDMFQLGTLYYLEPKIFPLIKMINSQLKEWDLYVSSSDFGESDVYYELTISKIGSHPILKKRGLYENSTASASTGGSGAVASATVSSTSVEAGAAGSGDIANTLKLKPKSKRGNPSQVSDLRYLAPVKIKRVKDI